MDCHGPRGQYEYVFLFLNKLLGTNTHIGRDLCFSLCNYETEAAYKLLFRVFHQTVEQLSGHPLLYKVLDTDTSIRLNGWTVDMDIQQSRAFGAIMRELLQARLQEGTLLDAVLRQQIEKIVHLTDDLDVALWFLRFCLVHCDR
jgi:hypothetical protein